MGLHITVAKWVLPKGDWINGKGIEPDVKVTNVIPDGDTMSRDLDKQLDTAIGLLLK
jgi:C-terminal processing protease CtpA/Prc